MIQRFKLLTIEIYRIRFVKFRTIEVYRIRFVAVSYRYGYRYANPENLQEHLHQLQLSRQKLYTEIEFGRI
jgi:hypothetical protein